MRQRVFSSILLFFWALSILSCESDEMTCCSYRKRVTSPRRGTWQNQCECIFYTCDEVEDGTDCFGGECVDFIVRDVKEVLSCEDESECETGQRRCVNEDYYQICQNGQWMSKRSCFSKCKPADGVCLDGYCTCGN